MTKVLKPRTFLLVKMSICGGEACRPSLMVAIQRWWRVWAAGLGWAGRGRGCTYSIVQHCLAALLCSALRPGPGPSNSEHNTGSDPPAILMLGNIFPPAILIVGDKIPSAIQMKCSPPHAWGQTSTANPPSCLGTHFHQQSSCLGTSLRQYNFVKSELQFRRTPRPTRFLRKGRQWQVNAE